MAEKTLYDILEVSSSASSDAIQAAHARLSRTYDPYRAENQGNAAIRIQHDAINDAFKTLANPEMRARYDKKLEQRLPALRNVQAAEPFWTLPKLFVVGLMLLILGAFYFKYAREQERLATEKAVAEAKARADVEKARAEQEQARIEVMRASQERSIEAQQRRESDAALRQFQAEQRSQSLQNRRDLMNSRSEEAKRQREEAAAAAAARQQLARDKAELCRIERERYGRAISC